MATAQDLAAKFAGIETAFENAESALAAGDLPELKALEQRIGRLCQQLLELAPDEAAVWADALEALSHRVDALEAAALAARDAAKARLEALSAPAGGDGDDG